MTELVSAEAIKQSVAQHNNNPFIVLLTFNHATLAAPIRIARNRADIVSRGNTYTAYPFQITLATDSDDNPQAKVTVANVSRAIGRSIEAMIEPPVATVEIVLASTPDTVERSWSMFQLTDASWDAFRVTGTLQIIQYWDEPYPKMRVVPSKFPGLFP